MKFTDDLDKCMAKADEYIRIMEESSKNEFWTAYALTQVNLIGILRSVKFCLSCAAKKKAKFKQAHSPYSKWSCAGGCIHPMSLKKQTQINKNLVYIKTVMPKLDQFIEKRKKND